MKLIFLLVVLILSSESLYSQAYCALRQPQSKIMTLFPDCENYKTIVATIDDDVRLRIESELGFPLYFYEIGRHNLYAIKKKNKVIGVVHSRSEKSQWGLVEIIWSLNLDMSVKSYDFQRCRSASKKELMTDEFKSQIEGKTFNQLLAFEQNPESISGYENLSREGKTLCQLLIRSSLKTLALTELAWKDELQDLRVRNITGLSSEGSSFQDKGKLTDGQRIELFKINENDYCFRINNTGMKYADYLGVINDKGYEIIFSPTISSSAEKLESHLEAIRNQLEKFSLKK